jgi:hypothetical protein
MLVIVLLVLANVVFDRRRNSKPVPRRHGAALSSADLNAWSAAVFVTGIGAPKRLVTGIGSASSRP